MNLQASQNVEEQKTLMLDFKLKKPKSLYRLQGSLLFSKYGKQTSFEMPLISIKYLSFEKIESIVKNADFNILEWEYLEDLGQKIYDDMKSYSIRLSNALIYADNFESEHIKALQQKLREHELIYDHFCFKFNSVYNYDFDKFMKNDIYNHRSSVY
jgi:hypothetical protein